MITLPTAVRLYVEKVNQVVNKAYSFLPEFERPEALIEEGRRYYKVVVDHRRQRSVHAFVDKQTLDLYKPAGWNAPAKGVRYNLDKDFEVLQLVVDPYGSYLYESFIKENAHATI